MRMLMSITLIMLVNICTVVVHVHCTLVSQAGIHMLVHICYNDALGTNASFKTCTHACKPWLHVYGINLPCKGDHAIGNIDTLYVQLN